MPRFPLSCLRPKDFPKQGDGEDEFETDNEDTDPEWDVKTAVEDAGGAAIQAEDVLPHDTTGPSRLKPTLLISNSHCIPNFQFTFYLL